MKTNHVSVLAAVVVASLGANAAHAIQKHDPIFQKVLAVSSGVSDPDLIRQVRYQNGSPKARVELYVARSCGPGMDRDLAREIRYQNGSPKSKSDQSFYLAPLK
jgi:hypothetical protein